MSADYERYLLEEELKKQPYGRVLRSGNSMIAGRGADVIFYDESSPYTVSVGDSAKPNPWVDAVVRGPKPWLTVTDIKSAVERYEASLSPSYFDESFLRRHFAGALKYGAKTFRWNEILPVAPKKDRRLLLCP